MHRHRSRNRNFPLVLSGITFAGLISALVDATLGWENIAQSILIQTLH